MRIFNYIFIVLFMKSNFILGTSIDPAINAISKLLIDTKFINSSKNIYNDFFLKFQRPKEYDFIIVGSGPAGSVLANRLSEIPDWNILLIEAGEPESYLTDVPGLCGYLQVTDYNWNYKMEKVNGACMGMENQQCVWPRGKALGGTSVINYMIHTRGNSYDFQRWEAAGNPGWSWNDVLPYYIKLEKAKLKYSDSGYHGKKGFLNVEDVPYETPLANAFLDAGLETGRTILDYNGKSQFGFSKVQANLRNGKRCSASKAYLRPIVRRKNLTILTRTRVSKVLIDPKTKTAFGVEYLKNKKLYRVLARKEVILSAGAFSSPQLLMLSGIGPKDHLQELKIPVIQNLQVGQNLHDHLTFVGLSFLINQTVSYNLNKFLTSKAILKYIANNEGPYTSIGGVEALGYIKTNVSTDPRDFPDIELIFVGGSISSDGDLAFREAFGISQEFYNELYGPINNVECWSIIPMLLHPKSIGYMRLKSKNVFHHPILHGNYYTDPEQQDVRTMVAAVKEILRLSKTKAFQKFGSTLHNIPFPTCKHLLFGSDEYWECCLRSITPSLHHQVGTCKMGPKTDPTAVVDSKLNVYGIQKLRVVDTSIIPFALSAHTNAPSFMIGERAADFIKETWVNLSR